MSGLTHTEIKICGFTTAEDVAVAVNLGVDYIGLNLAKGPRKINLEQAVILSALIPESIKTVLLFIDAEPAFIREAMHATSANFAQLHGHETQSYADDLRQDAAVIKAFRVRDAQSLCEAQKFNADIILLDAYVAGHEGGTGQAWDYRLLQDWSRKQSMMLAGGLHAYNLADAIRSCQPQAVDIASGVEASPGIKDSEKMKACIDIARGARP
ncbi:MAG: phosphoribosylanthranilate isomerase [Planctomycetes bacterium]|nr:phosphoribosylanthranilate isomerase [Planctomycetota bacterium]